MRVYANHPSMFSTKRLVWHVRREGGGEVKFR